MLRRAHRTLGSSFVAALIALLLPGLATAAPPTIQCPGPVQTIENGGFQITITASDPDNDPVTLRCVNPPSRAEFDPPTGIFSWVPTFQQAGLYNVQFQAAANGETTSCIVPVTVLNLDRSPVTTCPAPVTLTFTDTLRTQLVATDPDHDPLTWSSPNLPKGATLTPAGLLVLATVKSGVGTFNFEVDVNDGTVNVACAVTVHVQYAALPPRITCPGTIIGSIGNPINFTVVAASPAGQAIALTAAGLPTGAHFDGSTGLFQWTPGTQGGSFVMTFTARDASGRTTECTTEIDLGTGQAPVFTQCPGTLNSPELAQILLQFKAVDPQGFNVSYVANNLPPGATFLSQFGTLSWTPAVGQAGAYDMSVTASNGSKTANCPVHLVIAAVQPPQFTTCPGNLSGTESQPLQFQVAANDPQGFPLTLTATGMPSGATFTAATGIFSWTPAIAQAGSSTVTIQASSKAGTAQCAVHLTIAPVSPGKPVISCPAGSPFQVTETQALSFAVTATDPQSRSLTLQLLTPPAGSTFAAGIFRWTPTLVQAGSYTLKFAATNGFLADTCAVTVTVLNRANTPPHIACPAPLTTSVNRVVAFTVNAIDDEGDAIQYASRNLPVGATFANGQFAWSPADAAAGTYVATLIATDGELRDSCTVALDVVPHAGAVGALEPVIGHVRDIRPDQGGWVRVTLIAAPNDATNPVTGYGLWRRIAGPDLHALTPVAQTSGTGAAHPALPAARAGSIVLAAQAASLGFPPGTWESVSFTPSLQSPDLFIDVPTRDDSSAAGRPYEIFVATAHTPVASIWAVSPMDSGYSVDDLPPRAPAGLIAQPGAGGVQLRWSGSPDPDLDHYTIERSAGAEFAPPDVELLGSTRDSAFVDTAPRVDAWYRVLAFDVHGNAAASSPASGPRAAAWGVRGVLLSAPRPNPTRGTTAFDLVLPAAGAVAVDIVDARGARVRRLLAGSSEAGRQTLAWDGRDDGGRTVASGLYQLRVRAAGVSLTRKIILLR